MAKQSRMTNKSINQSIGHEFTYVGPPPEPILSCRNQFRWLHCLELRNVISCLFQNVLKNRGSMKIACQKWKWQQSFIKNVILELKEALRMKYEAIRTIWTPGFKRIYKMGFRMWDIRERRNVGRTEFPDVRHPGRNGGGERFRVWDTRMEMAAQKDSGCDTRMENDGAEGFRVWHLDGKWRR